MSEKCAQMDKIPQNWNVKREVDLAYSEILLHEILSYKWHTGSPSLHDWFVFLRHPNKYITVTQQFHSLKWSLTSYTPSTLLYAFRLFVGSRKWFQTILHTQKPGVGHQNQVSSMARSKIMIIWHFDKPLGCSTKSQKSFFVTGRYFFWSYTKTC